jgi:RNA polymerase sigma-70 factor (ECF subfamily)
LPAKDRSGNRLLRRFGSSARMRAVRSAAPHNISSAPHPVPSFAAQTDQEGIPMDSRIKTEQNGNPQLQTITPTIQKTKTPTLGLLTKNTNYEEMSDAELVLACQRKDTAALTHLLTRHKRTITGMFYKLAPDWKDTGDLVQEAYIRVWRSIGKLKNPNSFMSWLNKIVTNLFYDELRKRPQNFHMLYIDEPLSNENGSEKTTRDIADDSQQPEDKVLSGELSKKLAEAIASIPEQFRTAAVLRDIEGLSYEEIAGITRAEIGTVKSRICRARLKLQEHLAPYLKEAA